MTSVTNETIKVGGSDLAIVRGGTGKPLLILHDELGYPGWMTWNEKLAQDRTLMIPLQPGFGKTPRIDWILDYRDLAGFYSQALREMKLDPIDVIGFSAGGFIAAEMAAADPQIFSRMVLVAPMGIKASRRRDFRLLRGYDRDGICARRSPIRPKTPEFAKIYGGEMTPDAVRGFRGRARGDGAHRLGAVHAQSQPAASAARYRRRRRC